MSVDISVVPSGVCSGKLLLKFRGVGMQGKTLHLFPFPSPLLTAESEDE